MIASSDLAQQTLTLRRTYKLTQTELGKRLGVSRRTIVRIERGEVSKSARQTIQLALESVTAALESEQCTNRPLR